MEGMSYILFIVFSISFYMVDSEGQTMEVHLHMAQPQGLLQSESIVIDGVYKDGAFHATDMLLKCPSKYNSDNHLITDSEWLLTASGY